MRPLIFPALLLLTLHVLAAEGDKPRAARSVHLNYTGPDANIYYNEVTVDESTKGSYFCTCGFSHGYFGIQELYKGNKVAIFSVWDPGKQNDPNSVADEQRVKVLFSGEGVNVSRFGGEGTGGKSVFPFEWKNGETYKLMVKATAEADKTTYAGYIYLNDKKEWKQLATFQTLTKGSPLKGFYSFVEDFRRDGKSPNERRAARYGNGWVRTLDGKWVSLTKIKFTGDKTPLDNIDASVAENGFLLATGGETKNNTPLNGSLTREATTDTPPEELLRGADLKMD
jgi:hypothetical protein